MFKRFFWSLAIFIGLCAAVTYGNYTATQGAGTTFGSVVVGGIHYAQMMLCDLTTPSQCAAVSAGGAINAAPSSNGTWSLFASTQNVSSPTNTTLIGGQFNTTPTTITSGNASPLQMDNTGNLLVKDNAVVTAINAPINPATTTTGSLTGVTCGSAVSSCVLKNSSGNLYGVYAECTNACWLMVFNSISAPSNGSTTAGIASGNLVECVDISANGSKSITYPVFPANYTVGITAVISSTACATLTLSTVGFVRGTIQ